MTTITIVMLPYMIILLLFFGITNAFTIPYLTYGIVDIHYVTESQKRARVECTLSKALTGDEIEQSEKKKCYH
ncbi:hypothetical protein BDF20DRAFT_877507 [Mycotypha africana]|uniref:uncharacterized protein n=1 Tax=Mycotypha africana TaxID=64632 RepID=UPI002300FC7A|nr:uncharacterized protein BDF20DRAFT_877507 [Mycotypha africana]KAI8975226.1 hypothetical protein BDF20DRAFT_877507 [Mycotypha africana]